MKYKQLFKRITAATLATLMSMSLFAGCRSSSSGAGESADDTITLTVFSQLANYSGEQTGWIADILKDKFNVVLNIVPDLNGTYQTRMEAGDLGDIVVFGSDGDDYLNAVNAGLLYDWNEDDLVQEYGPYIYENMQNALSHNANISGGTTYGFGNNVALSVADHESFVYIWDIRWDLYSQLGYPEVKNYDDLVDLFVKMKEICPTDDNGNPTYAVALWPDWDGAMAMCVKSTATAYYGYDEFEMGLYDPVTGEFYDCLQENGPYIEALRFYNKLYQNNLLDPDSMTCTYDYIQEKVAAGGTFFSIFNYTGNLLYNTPEHIADNKMMLSLIPDDAKSIAYGMSTYGGNRIWAIGAKTEYPEECMEVINWLCSPEGVMTAQYGPQGDTWDYDENGNTYFTELGKKTNADVETSMEEVGYSGTFHDGQLQINNVTLSLDSVNPDSNGERFNCDFWESNLTEAENDVEQDWRDFTGVETTEEYMETHNYQVATASEYSAASKGDELQTKWDQTKEAILTGSWNAIYANSDDEFDSIVAEMSSNAKAYYYDECVEWSKEQAAIRKAAEDLARASQ